MSEAIVDKIISRGNMRYKNARAVREGRDETKIFIDGLRLAEEAIKSNLTIAEAFIAESFASDDRRRALLSRLIETKAPIWRLPDALAHSLSDTQSGQGITVIAERPAARAPAAIFARTARVPVAIFVERVNNPSNLGAIIRSAEAADIRGVITSENSANLFSPKVLRASMGSAFRFPIATATMETSISEARSAGFTVTLADAHGGTAHDRIDWSQPRLLIFGSEAHGVQATALGHPDEKVKIEINPLVESLNLGAACAIMLFEARRQALASANASVS